MQYFSHTFTSNWNLLGIPGGAFKKHCCLGLTPRDSWLQPWHQDCIKLLR